MRHPVTFFAPNCGRTRSSYLYAQYGDSAHPYVYFAFASHKDEENVRRIVGSYEGYLQSDAYICYELIAAASENRILAVGCWAHARRKFEPLIEAGPHPQAAWILGEIQKLYDIEDRARDMTDSQRLALRQAESRPIVDGIRNWLDERDREELPKSPLRAGVNYLCNRWEAFERFLEDGAIPIDNNRTEAVIKGPVMGKKAWLFFGNENGGRDGGHPLHADDELQAALDRRAGLPGGRLPPNPHCHASRVGITSARPLDPGPSGSPARATGSGVTSRRGPQTSATRPAATRGQQRLAGSPSPDSPLPNTLR